MESIKYKVTRFPPDDDPGWYEADIWDCPECNVTKIAADCPDCPGCLCLQPEGAVYRGKCWGMKMESDPLIKLSDLKPRPLISGPRGESLADIKEIDDEDFLVALRNAGSLK